MDVKFTSEEYGILNSFIRRELIKDRAMKQKTANANGVCGTVGYMGMIPLANIISACVPLEMVPLYINSEDPYILGVAKGRLSIGR